MQARIIANRSSEASLTASSFSIIVVSWLYPFSYRCYWARACKKMFMSQNDTLHLAQEFLGRMGGGAEPAEIAKLFSENMEWK